MDMFFLGDFKEILGRIWPAPGSIYISRPGADMGSDQRCWAGWFLRSRCDKGKGIETSSFGSGKAGAVWFAKRFLPALLAGFRSMFLGGRRNTCEYDGDHLRALSPI